MVNFPICDSLLPALVSFCHAQAQATTTLHQMTHTPGTYNVGTNDNAHGYSASIVLSSSQADLNVNSYALYANGENFLSFLWVP